jgi:hypothetical protein
MSFRKRFVLRAWDEHVAHEAEHRARFGAARLNVAEALGSA